MRHSGLVYFAAIDQLMVIVKLNRSSWQVQLVGISSPFEKLANEEDSCFSYTHQDWNPSYMLLISIFLSFLPVIGLHITQACFLKKAGPCVCLCSAAPLYDNPQQQV